MRSGIYGVGARKAEDLGEAFVSAIAQATPERYYE